MLSVTCPHCGQDLFEPNPGWKKIVQLYTTLRKAGQISATSIINVDLDTEFELFSLGSWEIGERMASSIMTNGVRDTFVTIFGHQVKWDAPKLEIA
jgi:hypothetical protein